MSDVYEIQGKKVSLPCIVRDASSGNALYTVPANVVQKLLPGDAFEPVETTDGETQVILAIIDYRDNDLGDYDEVGIIFTVKPKGAGPEAAGTFIYRLPVNQSFTCEAGATIWGFPKTVEQIDYRYTDTVASCRLEMDGKHVFTLTLPRTKSDAPAGDDMQTPTYTYIDGIAHATNFSTGGVNALNLGGAGVKLELGDHAIADELRELGLENATPIMSVWTENMSGSFASPQKV